MQMEWPLPPMALSRRPFRRGGLAINPLMWVLCEHRFGNALKESIGRIWRFVMGWAPVHVSKTVFNRGPKTLDGLGSWYSLSCASKLVDQFLGSDEQRSGLPVISD